METKKQPQPGPSTHRLQRGLVTYHTGFTPKLGKRTRQPFAISRRGFGGLSQSPSESDATGQPKEKTPTIRIYFDTIRHMAYRSSQQKSLTKGSIMEAKQRVITQLQTERKVLKNYTSSLDLLAPGQRLCLEILFVLTCGLAGLFVAAIIAPLRLLPESAFPWFSRILALTGAIGAGYTCLIARQKADRYQKLSDEIDQLNSNVRDQEFVTDTPALDHLNTIERWILGKPEPTVADLMAHPQRSAFLLPWWQLIGQPRWHLPAALSTTLAINLLAGYVLLPVHPLAAAILIAIAPIPLVFVFLRFWMFRQTDPRLHDRNAFRLLVSESKTSLYQHWLLLNRLKRKGLIDPNAMELIETDFPTNNYLFSVFSPAAALLPIEGVTVSTTKLFAAQNSD
jgi:hypothetical protein